MKVLVAMSGGVDSSVAAKLLVDNGYECIGCTMKLYNNEDISISNLHTCCSLDDVEDARSVAYKLGMLYYVFNFTDDFRLKVIDRFVKSYENGITPNPCIDCNRYMKFEKLFQRAQILKCDYIATGHYARIACEQGRYILKKAVDETKDQSYVLYSMTQEQLAHTLFPLGNLNKTETRKIAEESGFINAKKPDSQDICFVPNGNYASVIELNTGKKVNPGNFVDSDGNVIGTHNGIIHYTIGQRRKLGLHLPEAYYVCKIFPDTNTVMLGKEAELYQRELMAKDFNWVSIDKPASPIRCKAKIRYRQIEQWATVLPSDDDSVNIIFDDPQRAITPGQAVVLYKEDIVLGGGIIAQSK